MGRLSCQLSGLMSKQMNERKPRKLILKHGWFAVRLINEYERLLK